MLSRKQLHGALTIGLAAAVAYLALNAHALEPSRASVSQTPSGAVVQAENTPSRDQKKGSLSDERELGRVRQALLSRALSDGSNTTSPAAAQNPLALAQTILDQRLVSGAANPSESARLEQTLRPLLVPAVLGEAVAEISCNATLCKIGLVAEDESRVTRAASALAERLPKTFSAVVVYPESTGHRSVYLSTRSTDLELSPPPAVVAGRELAK